MATTALEHVLLGYLAAAPASGYDLRLALRATPGRRFSSSPGSVYPALRRLEARGLVRSTPEPRGSPRQKRRFRTTRSGLAELRAWIEAPVTRAEVEADVALPVLRFAFAEGHLPRSEVIAFLVGFRDVLSAHLEEVRALAGAAHPTDTHRALALRHDVATRAASLRWVEDTLARLPTRRTAVPRG